jgi:hypothetical protein
VVHGVCQYSGLLYAASCTQLIPTPQSIVLCTLLTEVKQVKLMVGRGGRGVRGRDRGEAGEATVGAQYEYECSKSAV